MELVTILAALLVIVLISFGYYQKNKNLPPGPWNLPIVGYLPWLDPKVPYVTLTNLSRIYGPIYGLYLGSVYTVVISDATIIKETFNKDAASGRAPLYLTHGIMKGYGLICAQGDLWKDQRKFVHNTLRVLGASKIGHNRKKMETLITDNILELVEEIKDQGSVVLDPLPFLRHTLGSVVNKIVFGRSWKKNDETWIWLQDLQEEGTKHIGVSGPINFLPFLRFLPKFKRTVDFLIEGKEKTHQLYSKIVAEQKFDPENNPTNFVQAFLLERSRKQDSEKFYNDNQFFHLLADLFGASLDTTLTSLRWYLLYIAVNREIQTKIRFNLKEVLNGEPPTLDDLPNLPYVEASIAEVQRIRSVVPVGIPHGTLEEMAIENYKIPKSSMIIPLQWAVHMNHEIWRDPEQFQPERFIDEEGRFFKPDSFIPFQAGKRMCVGDSLAKMLLFLFAATLIQKFEISVEEADFTGDCGITLTPKPYKLIFSST